MSEGRGSTRPFELIGADYINPFDCADALNQLALPGIRFRPVYFQPTFHKYGGQSIGGLALHVTDRQSFQPLRMGLHVLATVRRLYGEQMSWRTEVYEFVKDRLAIDLLFGGPEARSLIEANASPAELDTLWNRWQGECDEFDRFAQDFRRYT